MGVVNTIMATALSSNEWNSSRSELCNRLCQPPYELHRAVFEGDLETVKKLVRKEIDCVHSTDSHGRLVYNI